LFAEKLKFLESTNLTLQYFYQEFLRAGPEALADFEKMLVNQGRKFTDLLNITKRHVEEQRDAKEWIEEFLQNKNQERRKVLIGYIAKLI